MIYKFKHDLAPGEKDLAQDLLVESCSWIAVMGLCALIYYWNFYG